MFVAKIIIYMYRYYVKKIGLYKIFIFHLCTKQLNKLKYWSSLILMKFNWFSKMYLDDNNIIKQ